MKLEQIIAKAPSGTMFGINQMALDLWQASTCQRSNGTEAQAEARKRQLEIIDAMRTTCK